MINLFNKSQYYNTELKKVLGGTTPTDTLTTLANSVDNSTSVSFDLKNTAIAFDANAILRIPQDNKYADIIDYISSRDNPIIISSQILQEFWNNKYNVIQSNGQKFKKKFEELKKEAEYFGDFNEEISTKINTLLSEIDEEYKHVYDNQTMHKIKSFLEVLKEKGEVSYVDRQDLFPIAQIRMMTKTPPGFEDSGDGDFFVWAEILNGAMNLLSKKKNFDKLVFVTNDVKRDWVIKGIPHPVLTAEVKKLINKPFEIWTLQNYITAIKNELSA